MEQSALICDFYCQCISYQRLCKSLRLKSGETEDMQSRWKVESLKTMAQGKNE